MATPGHCQRESRGGKAFWYATEISSHNQKCIAKCRQCNNTNKLQSFVNEANKGVAAPSVAACAALPAAVPVAIAAAAAIVAPYLGNWTTAAGRAQAESHLATDWPQWASQWPFTGSSKCQLSKIIENKYCFAYKKYTFLIFLYFFSD